MAHHHGPHGGHSHSHSHGHHDHLHGGGVPGTLAHDGAWEEGDAAGEAAFENEEEQRHFLKVVDAFNHYKVNSLAANAKRKRDWEQSIADRHRSVVGPSYGERLDRIDCLIEQNYGFIRRIIEEESPFPFDDAKNQHLVGVGDVRGDPVTEQDMDKCRTTLRQFVRDWSAEGVVERETSYAPMIQALERYFSDLDVDERGSIYVLVPGAGLGRLAYDVAKRGFSCQGNEFSFFMLLASNFVLNKCSEAEQFTIYPWIHSLSNCLKPEDVLRGVSVPDVLPGDLLETVDFSMAAGDFVEVYGSPAQAGKWDCVMTCFFLDTAKNVVEYVEIINKCLVQGGLWINLGPLLYHFEGMVNEPSIELSYEDLLRVVDAYGFSILEEKGIDTTYSNNLRSMMTFTYHARFFVARKQPGT